MSLTSRIIVPAIAVAAGLAALLWFQRSNATLDTSAMHIIPDGSEAFPGGTTSVPDTGLRAFGRSPMNISEDRWRKFIAGKIVFDRNWVRMKGASPIGPLYSSVSCDGCHTRDGRGRPPLLPDEEPQSMIIRLASAHSASLYGEQLDYRAINGATPEGSVRVEYEEESGNYNDGTEFLLYSPIYTFTKLAHGPLDDTYQFSPRVAPMSFGLGLLEAVPESDIVAHADPEDRDSDGISGRANYTIDRRTGKRRLGRFGWKAIQPTIEQQIASAFLSDLGITSVLFPVAAHHDAASGATTAPELTAEDLDLMVYYTTLTPPPTRRAFNDPTARHGQAIFNGIGCVSCHVPSMRTGTLEGYPEVSAQRIYPYTDLLLHDMGDELADGFPEGEANGREWRTPPLWGIGLIPTVNKHTRLLHDGRARSIEEAILWHGGEAERAARLFRSLSAGDRTALITFLKSI